MHLSSHQGDQPWGDSARIASFYPYTQTNLILWGNFKILIERRLVTWRNGMEKYVCVYVCTLLSQLISKENELFTFDCKINSSSPPQPTTAWQYMQLSHSLSTHFGPDALVASESPPLWQACSNAKELPKAIILLHTWAKKEAEVDLKSLRLHRNLELVPIVLSSQWTIILCTEKSSSLDMHRQLRQQKMLFRIRRTPA